MPGSLPPLAGPFLVGPASLSLVLAGKASAAARSGKGRPDVRLREIIPVIHRESVDMWISSCMFMECLRNFPQTHDGRRMMAGS